MPNMPDAIVLCGGAGLRLRGITGDGPKAMASIGDRPFLELLLRQLRRHGFRRVILAVGYRSDVIHSHFDERALGLQLEYSVESCPLGTGGALRNAAGLIGSNAVLVMNGDSYTDADLGAFVADHHTSHADLSVVIVNADGRGDCGSVLIDGSGRLTGFAEKQDLVQASYVNAGIYLLSKQMLYEMLPGLEVSLERELLPRWLREDKNIRGFNCPGRCIDIGTPERYRDAQCSLAEVEMDISASHQGSQL